MSNDFQSRMRRQNTNAPALQKDSPVSNTDQDVFFAGSEKVVGRKLSPEEKSAVSQGKDPYAGLTEHERRTAIALGLNTSVPINSNLADNIAKLVPKAALDAISKQAGAPNIRPAIEINSLPEQEQEKVRQTLNAISANQEVHTEFSTAYPDSVRETLENMQNGTLKKIELPDDIADENLEQTESQPSEQESKPHNYGLDNLAGHYKCTHCGKDPFNEKIKVAITKEDKKAFLISLGTDKSFEKEYSALGGVITVRFRSFREGEQEWIHEWALMKATADMNKMDIKPPWDVFRDMYSKNLADGYVAVQTTYLACSIPGSPIFWKAPTGTATKIADWQREYPEIDTLDKLVESFNLVVVKGSVAAAIRNKLQEFTQLDYDLLLQSENTENFWAGI
ncbi:hypothetical protein FACS1894214_0100 [Planctomycetales bacterium]|nr:hypothetical protein FACS1894214_0100 [Planctomycetales bacterium]